MKGIKMIKKISLTMIVLAVLFTNLQGQSPKVLSCRQVMNCVPTGFTIDLTVEYLEGNVAKVTRNIRPSTPDDIACCYNMTNFVFHNLEDGIFISGDADTKYIPFEGNLMVAAEGGSGYKVWCVCEGESGTCGIGNVGDDVNAFECKSNGCTGCCSMRLQNPYPSTSPNISGLGIFIQASRVIFVDNM